MNKQKQNGSIALVITVLIVVIILGIVGAITWKNISSNESKKTPEQTSSETKNNLKEASVDPSFPKPLSWKYPDDWTIDSTGQGPKDNSDTATQSFTLTSPSGKYSVIYQVGVNGGRGGACTAEDAGTVQYISQKATPTLQGGRFVEFIGTIIDTASPKKETAGYFYRSGITNDSTEIQSAKVGTSVCFYGLGGLMLDEKTNYDLLSASIQLNDFIDRDGDTKPVDSVEPFKTAFESDEYKQAVEILLSTKLN